MLSCCDSVWEPIKVIPDDIRHYFTDDLGNRHPEYGGFVFTNNVCIVELLEINNLYLCFRGVYEKYLDTVDYVFRENPVDFIIPLHFMGWDIAIENGWVSASLEGSYPIDPIDGTSLGNDASKINEYGLFYHETDCLTYCAINEQEQPKFSPWYPVAVYVDSSSYRRIKEIYKNADGR